MSSEAPHQFAINVAAEAFRVNRDEIERDLKHGRFPNAQRGGITSAWMIPRADLEAAGYKIDPRWEKWRAAYSRNAHRKLNQEQ